MLALAYADITPPQSPWIGFDAVDGCLLKVQNQRNPQGEGPFGFQIEFDDVYSEIELAETVLDFPLSGVFYSHNKRRSVV